MALLNSKLAIMSVGMSCQPAHQIRQHADVIARASGQTLELHTTPWDWLICGPAGVAAMVGDGVTFPRDPAELEQRAKPYWPARACYFWHVKGAITHHADGLARALQCEAQLEAVAAARRRVFILANTQNNLVGQSRQHGGFTVPLVLADVLALQAALLARFGAHELYVVSHRKKHALGDRKGVVELAAGGGQWQGDKRQWACLLASIAAGKSTAF